MQIRFRFIFVAVYLVVSGTLFAVCLFHMGQSDRFQSLFNSIFPAVLLHKVLRPILIPPGVYETSYVQKWLDVALGLKRPSFSPWLNTIVSVS